MVTEVANSYSIRIGGDIGAYDAIEKRGDAKAKMPLVLSSGSSGV